MMFDFPQPLGPTTPTRLPGKGSVVGSTNDLNPASLIFSSRIAKSLGGIRASQAPPALREHGAPATTQSVDCPVRAPETGANRNAARN
jgi:hypothetical protein